MLWQVFLFSFFVYTKLKVEATSTINALHEVNSYSFLWVQYMFIRSGAFGFFSSPVHIELSTVPRTEAADSPPPDKKLFFFSPPGQSLITHQDPLAILFVFFVISDMTSIKSAFLMLLLKASFLYHYADFTICLESVSPKKLLLLYRIACFRGMSSTLFVSPTFSNQGTKVNFFGEF